MDCFSLLDIQEQRMIFGLLVEVIAFVVRWKFAIEEWKASVVHEVENEDA